MEKVRIEEKGDIAILRLANGVTNAIDPAMVGELQVAAGQIRKNFKGMVLAGGEKFFSMGWHLPTLLSLDRQGMADFFYGFNDACMALYSLPIPTACAVRGHAVAGGHILALTCDFRLAATGKSKFGLNEIRLGVPVPYLFDMMQRQIVSERAATKILYTGELFSMEEAAEMGMADELTEPEALEERALAMVAGIAALPARAFAAMKENRGEEIRERYAQKQVKKNEAFLDCWLSAETQEILAEVAKKF